MDHPATQRYLARYNNRPAIHQIGTGTTMLISKGTVGLAEIFASDLQRAASRVVLRRPPTQTISSY